jgi:IS4 transposase
MMVLLFLFNPVVSSLRAIQQATELKKVQKKLGCSRASLGSLSEATDMLDVPAWIIALIYRYRWTIETFFRFFKHILGCRHLLSHDPVGIKLQTYCAIIDKSELDGFGIV